MDVHRIAVHGSVFDVRIKDSKAEAIRVNPQYAPRLGPIGARAAMAMQLASGCKVRKISGDAAVVHGMLTCAGQPEVPQASFPRNLELDCFGVDSHISPATNERITDYDCDVLAVD